MEAPTQSKSNPPRPGKAWDMCGAVKAASPDREILLSCMQE